LSDVGKNGKQNTLDAGRTECSEFRRNTSRDDMPELAALGPAYESGYVMRYCRRFRMEFSFAERKLELPVLPDGYRFVAWNPMDLDRHATAKFHSFRGEFDSQVFASLASLDGCRRLMLEIASQRMFLPEATWLVGYQSPPDDTSAFVDCGTIQGIASGRDSGSIQNVGVTPESRGIGLGRALIVKALHGFREFGVKRVYLEATAENIPAVELYRSIGFRLVRTTYKHMQISTPVEPDLHPS
jgi:ribosomal protein S18 acetylase RimI-like enzyme